MERRISYCGATKKPIPLKLESPLTNSMAMVSSDRCQPISFAKHVKTLAEMNPQERIDYAILAWQNPDVHARTPELRQQLLAEFQQLPQLTKDRFLAEGEFARVCIEIGRCIDAAAASKNPFAADARSCLEKIVVRRGAIDRDLCGVSVAGLLCVMWTDCIAAHLEDRADFFLATLADMGTTCVQGDSHRLFASYIALVRSTLSEDADVKPAYE